MDSRTARVLSLVEERPGIEIPSLAILVHLSPSRLRHVFEAQMSTSLHRYLKEGSSPI
jgi:AraC-like DNA-binding protein